MADSADSQRHAEAQAAMVKAHQLAAEHQAQGSGKEVPDPRVESEKLRPPPPSPGRHCA